MHLSHPKTIHPGARVLGTAGLERMKQLEVRAASVTAVVALCMVIQPARDQGTHHLC